MRVEDVATLPSGAPPAAPAETDERYELIERLGEGAMGVVWAARDRVLDRTVALKVLHDHFLGGDHQERLTAEARAMARLSHPNVVALYDVGERDGRVYLTMELVRGETIKDWMATRRPWREVVAVFRAAARGLAAAHDAGVIHRDVKPTNMLRGADGVVRVADFGVAHAGTPAAALAESAGGPVNASVTAGVIGTPAYMSPERLGGEPADARGDQFAFCVALYEALAGRRPFVAANLDELRAAVARGAPPPMGVPRWLARVLARGLSADPDARYPSMNAVVAALGGPRRRRVWIAAGIGAVALAAGAAAFASAARDEAPACDVAGELDGVWDAAARKRGSDAFAGLVAQGLPWAPATWSQLERGVDRYAAEWLAARDRVCRLGASAEAARRNHCLDDRRAALAGLLGSLATPDRALAERASGLVVRLPRIDDCERPTYLAGALADREASRQAREDLNAARVARITGRESETGALAERARAAARAAGDRWLEADALMVRGDAEMNTGRAALAVETLTASVELAGAIGAFDLQFDARLRLSQALDKLGRFLQANEVLQLAEESLVRLGDRPSRRGSLLVVRARVYGADGRFEEARALLERALVIYGETKNQDDDSVAVAHANLGNVLHSLARGEEALIHYERVKELRAGYGPDHPMIGKLHGEIASVLYDLGRADEAYREFERGIEILRRAPGKDRELAQAENNYGAALGYSGRHEDAVVHLRIAVEITDRIAPGTLDSVIYRANLAGRLSQVGQAEEAVPILRDAIAKLQTMPGGRADFVATLQQNLGAILDDLGRDDEAMIEYGQALAGAERAHGPEHPSVAQILVNAARIDLEYGRYRRMMERVERAHAIREKALPAEHPDQGEVLTFLAIGRLELGDAEGAITAAEAAIANLRKNDAAPSDAEWILARALGKTNRDRDRAVALARSARARYAATAPPEVEEIAKIDAWLARHARR